MTETTLADALATVQGQLTAVGKDKKVNAGQMRYTYADLASVQAAVFPLLSAAGLAWMARPTWDDQGRFVLAYSLLHGPSGEREDGAYPLPDPTRGTPQQAGSAITYAKRYCLSAIVGVATEDDDGKASSDAAAPRARPAERPADRGPVPPSDDPWASTPAAAIPVVTDAVWAKDFRQRIAGCDSLGVLRGLFGELSGQVQAEAVTESDAVELRRLVEEMAADLTKQAERADA